MPAVSASDGPALPTECSPPTDSKILNCSVVPPSMVVVEGLIFASAPPSSLSGENRSLKS